MLEVDGLLRNSIVLVLNEAKASATAMDVEGGYNFDKKVTGLRERVTLMKKYIADSSITTEPPEVMDVLREFKAKEAIPVLSTYHPSTDACRRHNIFCLMPQGPGGL